MNHVTNHKKLTGAGFRKEYDTIFDWSVAMERLPALSIFTQDQCLPKHIPKYPTCSKP
jgi:hypothetical protein